MEQLDMFSITAEQARNMYAEDAYIQGLQAVNQAILGAAPNSHEVYVTVTLNKTIPAIKIKDALQRHGFSVLINHDNENSLSELYVRW